MRRKSLHMSEAAAARRLEVDVDFMRRKRRTNKVPHHLYTQVGKKIEYNYPALEKWYNEGCPSPEIEDKKLKKSAEIMISTYEEEITYECVNQIESTNKTIEGMFVHHFIDAVSLHKILKIDESFDLWLYKIKKKGKFKRFKNENIFWDYKVVNNNDITSYMMKKHMAIMAVKLTKTKREDTDAICFSIESYLNSDKLGKSEY